MKTFGLALALAIFPLQAHAQELGPVVDRLAASWQRGDAGGIAARFADDGVSIALGGAKTGPVGARQASAMLRRLFEERETLRVQIGRARVVGGDPAKAFAELDWTARSRGTTIPVRATVFLALQLEQGEWRITEIRLLH